MSDLETLALKHCKDREECKEKSQDVPVPEAESNPVRKRRRRRPKTKNEVDDSEFIFHIQPYSNVEKKQRKKSIKESKSFRSVPLLLLEREIFGTTRYGRRHRNLVTSSKSSWTCQAIQENDGKWRQYCQKQIKFRKLRTPATDAVLALNNSGSYLISLAGNNDSLCNDDDNEGGSVVSSPQLAIRFYGIFKDKATFASTIPLFGSSLSDSPVNLPNNRFIWRLVDLIPAPIRVPVRLWITAEDRANFGACLSQPDPKGDLSSVVLFSAPKQSSSLHSLYWKLDNIHVPWLTHTAYTDGYRIPNLLWYTSMLPTRGVQSSSLLPDQSQHQHWICHSVLNIPSYLFLIDEDDGYRLTWVHEKAWKADRNHFDQTLTLERVLVGKGLVRSSNNSRFVVYEITEEVGWQRCVSESRTGLSVKSSPKSESTVGEIEVSFCAFFSVAALLHDILSRRPTLVKPCFDKTKAVLPTYAYHLVQIIGGRLAELLILFSVGPVGKGCIGVFVEIDLLTQDYVEKEFIRQTVVDTPPPTSFKLALKQRAEYFAKDTSSTVCEMIDAGNIAPVIQSLYPDCQTFDNAAVRNQTPIPSIKAANAPLEILYG